jgi:hypothetical protein
MLGLRLLYFLLAASCLFAQAPTASKQDSSAASLAAAIHQLSLDQNQTYRVRDIHWVRGDVSFYLNEGVLSFAVPIAGRTIAAIFTTQGVEAGDAEIVVSPKGKGERSSLAYFTKQPNLDEHFTQAVFLFTDATHEEITKQIDASVVRKAPELKDSIAAEWQAPLRAVGGDIDVPLVYSLLAGDSPVMGIFEALIGGRTLGRFDVVYNPREEETTTLGQVASVDGVPAFQIWASFAPRRRTILPPEDPFVINEYRIDATIDPDLRVDAVTRFDATPRAPNQRVFNLQLSQLSKVNSAFVDGQPAEVLQHDSVRGADENDVGRFLVLASEPLTAGKRVEVEIRHSGSFVKDEGGGIYFVQARNIWFPYDPSRPARLDLTFRCPATLRVVSSGKLVSETVEGRTRVVHRRIDNPVWLAGFNLGDFVGAEKNDKPFHIEVFANRGLLDRMTGVSPALESGPIPISGRPGAPRILGSVPIPGASPDPDGRSALQRMCSEVAEILKVYLNRWGPLPIQNVAVTPIPGAFGQGFPGLIYLSTIAYLPTDQRPPVVRDSILNVMFSDLLLAHELAHQWWGNLVSPVDYRSDWLIEALSNYAALQLYEERQGRTGAGKILLYYLTELTESGPNGKTVESTGPVDLGTRLKTSIGENSWRIITYDKGTWVIHMLRHRLGDRAFANFLRHLAAEYAGKTISNDEFRQAACRFLPKNDPDPTLELFFDAWVYGTGLPKLTLVRGQNPREYTLAQSGVPEDFTVDVPITLHTKGHLATVKWVRSSSDGTVFRVPSLSTKAFLPALSEFLYLQ